MSPFSKTRYKRMLEGLEIAEISSKKVFDQTITRRIDPEYFWKVYLEDEELLATRENDFCSMATLGLTVDASAFYPSIEGFYGSGSLPFLRVADVNTIIDFEGCTRIPENLCAEHSTLAKVRPGDILFTKGGSIARIGLVTRSAAVSRDLIFLNTSQLAPEDQAFLFFYFQTDFFNRALIRSSSQTAQPHLTITLVRELQVLTASKAFKQRLRSALDIAFKLHAASIDAQKEAEAILSEALNLETLQAPEPLSYLRSSSEVFAAKRLDAEHFQAKFKSLAELIDATGSGVRLGDYLVENQRGKQPAYGVEGLPVVNSKHVLRGEVRVGGENRTASFEDDDLLIQPGDVLLNGTGVGTIGRSATYLFSSEAIPDNHVTILRPTQALDPIYLSVFLNSRAGQFQVEQRLRGSSGQIELYPTDIAEFRVWVAPETLQRKIRKCVEQGFAKRQEFMGMLEAAKRAVEIAIEDGEGAALAYLKKAA